MGVHGEGLQRHAMEDGERAEGRQDLERGRAREVKGEEIDVGGSG